MWNRPACLAAIDEMLAAEAEYRRKREAYWDDFAANIARWEPPRRYFRRRLSEVYRLLVPPGKRVLELGSATGDLLASLEPSHGVGIDFSARMIELARARHPRLVFHRQDLHVLDLGECFDYIVCSDVVNDLWDVQRVFQVARKHSHAGTRLILNAYNRMWEAPRRAAEAMRIVSRQPVQNWLTVEDLTNLLQLADFEVVRRGHEVLWPFRTPMVDTICNRYLVKFAPFRWFALANFLVARIRTEQRTAVEPVVSVVIPCRNEAGNIAQILERVPDMGSATELIFVEGHSTDATYQTIETEIARRQMPNTKLLRQTGTGKGDAVRLGFQNASGELLMILDADLTVPPEDLPRFYDAWRSGKGDFINGVRLVYPMQERAMRFFNLVANKFFSLAFSWLLGQSVKDTLCGTKVLSRSDYETIAANRAYFGHLDPFGDFDLIFGAARYALKIVDLPVRYRERTYGETNIQRWKHGWLLLKMLLVAMRRLKFV